MKAGPRRALLFVAMVGVGLAVVFLLSDPLERRRGARFAEPSQADGNDARIEIDGPGTDRATQVVFPGEVEFDVLQEVEDASGALVEVPAYRVKIQSGLPDPSGAFLAEGPVVRLLDPVTGAETGTLSAQRARFELDSAVGGTVKVDLAHMNTRNFSLIGDVQGELLMADGQRARLRAERLDVEGSVVRAPGFVSWSRDDMSLTGQDMVWDGDTGRLDFASDATIALVETPERRGLELHAPGGLTWTMPPDAKDPRTESWGELRGPVTGVATDGTRIQADSLVVDGRTGQIRLLEGAVYEREVDGRLARLTAQHIALETDAAGQFALAQADGAVRLVTAPFAVLPAWMVTEHIRMEGSEVRAPGQVTWSQEGMVATGTEFTWDTAIGRLDYDRDAQLAVQEGGDEPLSGLRVLAPGGMTWTVPPEATDPLAQANGELRGQVTGTLPDGTTFSTDMLFFNGAERSFRLEGSAQFRRLADDTLSSIHARRITLGADEAQRLALVSAEGDVVLLSGPVDVLPARLVTQKLHREGGSVTSPDVVTWTRDGLTVVGTGMTLNEATGRLDFASDAQITYVDPKSALTLNLAAERGLWWVLPPGSKHALEDGHGELHGRVTGTTSDGSKLDTESLSFDGPSRTLLLNGPSRAEVAGRDAPLVVNSADLRVENVDVAPHVSTSAPVTWSRADMSGRGVGLTWDDPTGALHLDRDVGITFDAGPDPLVLTARGSLDWTVPPGATDAFREGRGELRDGVQGGSARQGHVHTDLLTLDGPAGRAVMIGPSHFERQADGEHVTLAASRSITVQAAADGTPQHLSAEGDARATLLRLPEGAAGGLDRAGDASEAAAGTLHLSGERLEVDRVLNVAELHGNAVVEQGVGADLRRVAARDLIRAHTDEHGELLKVQALGGVVCRLGEFEAQGDELTWDIVQDIAVLTGNCRLFAAGVEMDAAQVEVHPRAVAFRIVRATIRVQE